MQPPDVVMVNPTCCGLVFEKTCVGFCNVDVTPSPKFHSQETAPCVVSENVTSNGGQGFTETLKTGTLPSTFTT